MYAISRLLSMAREANDAISAHTEARMLEAPRMLKLPEKEQPQIWIRLPPSRRPTHWDTFEEPVVRLVRTLFGHPLASLLCV